MKTNKYIFPSFILVVGIIELVVGSCFLPSNFLKIFFNVIGGGMVGGGAAQICINRPKINRQYILLALIFILSLFLISSALFINFIAISVISLVIGILSSFYVIFRLAGFVYEESKKKSLPLLNTGIYTMGVDYARGVASRDFNRGASIYFNANSEIDTNDYMRRMRSLYRNDQEITEAERERIERERERIQEEYERRERERETGRVREDLLINGYNTDYQDRLRRVEGWDYNEDLRMRVVADQIRAMSLDMPQMIISHSPDRNQTNQTNQTSAAEVRHTPVSDYIRALQRENINPLIPATPANRNPMSEEMNRILLRYRNIADYSAGIPSSLNSPQPESSKSVTPANSEVKIVPKVELPVVIKVQSAIDQLEVESTTPP